MEKKFEIIEGDDEPDPLSQILRIGTFAVDVTKKSFKGGILFAAEIGNTVMYTSGQRRYAQDLAAREPKDRLDRELKTSLRAFTKKRPDIELGKFAARYVVAATRALAKMDAEKAKSNAPAIAELVDAMPDTVECAEFAEEVITLAFEPIVTTFNKEVSSFSRGIPAPREPID